MASVVEICNSSLNILGATRIVSLTEDSKNARLLNQRYEPVRDAVFRAHPWNCLLKRVELAQDTATPAFEYSYQYTLPSDCLRVIRSQYSEVSTGEEYRVEGRKILSDESTIKILYVAKITDPNEFDTLLRETVAARLAHELCFAITQNNGLVRGLYELYELKLREARHADAAENSVDTVNRFQANEFITSRL
jgi:hypothetical protein|tara:strand:+ start:119 stop:697 length:579 start_codon:yes stop_codon:yes gene_type:complete